ncbi:MAG: hypothetical protein F9K37_03410 [Bacteroidales bacterium]|nr:MAG: hypothetical protein F9K37_03410 [Bacteroidales bacterium]
MKIVAIRVMVLLAIVFLVDSCTKNIEPFPDAVKLNTSFSLPVGSGEVSLSKTLETLGVPSVNLTENVPEWATYGVVYYADTLPLNLTEVYDNAEFINYLMIRTNIWNDFPLGGFAQVYFLDGSDSVIDSLYNERVTVPAAEHYDDGVVVGTKFESFRTEFSKARIELLSDAKKVVIYSGLIVTNEGVTESNINYFDRYKLKVQVALRVDFSFNAD